MRPCLPFFLTNETIKHVVLACFGSRAISFSLGPLAELVPRTTLFPTSFLLSFFPYVSPPAFSQKKVKLLLPGGTRTWFCHRNSPQRSNFHERGERNTSLELIKGHCAISAWYIFHSFSNQLLMVTIALMTHLFTILPAPPNVYFILYIHGCVFHLIRIQR